MKILKTTVIGLLVLIAIAAGMGTVIAVFLLMPPVVMMTVAAAGLFLGLCYSVGLAVTKE